MEIVRTTDPMVILRENVRCISSRKLLIREAAYDTVSTQTVLLLHQIKTFEREMKIRMMVHIKKSN